jgi:formamidopyrimidine-DNA glycosylase
MPELPELENTARAIRPALERRRIVSTWLRHATLYRRGSLSLRWLIDHRITHVQRVGKNVLIRLRPEGVLVVNLGMTGHLTVAAPDAAPEGLARSHFHARLRLSDGRELRYYDARRFGHFYVAESCDFRKDLNIGPDPFEAECDYFAAALHGRDAPIKSLLLDQRILSGIGNIYADETLYYAGIHPLTPGGKVARRCDEVLGHARTVLQWAIDKGGSTIRDYRNANGQSGKFQNHHAVYGRAELPCLECGVEVERVVISGRSTHFCPNCQR